MVRAASKLRPLLVLPILGPVTSSYCSSVNRPSNVDSLKSQPSFGATVNVRQNHSHGNNHKNAKVGNDVNELVLISGSAHRQLAADISKHAKVPLLNASLGRFADGEVSIQLNEDIRGKNVFIIQPCAAPVNDSIMELLFSISCSRRAGARRVTAVIPYFGYKHHRRGSSISTLHHSRYLTSSANDFAKMLQEMGADRVVAVDIQRPGQGQEACFFDNFVPFESISTVEYMVEHVARTIKSSDPIVVISPNTECVKKARNFQLGLQKLLKREVNLAVFNVANVGSGPYDPAELQMLGSHKIAGSQVIIVDDMVDTAGTLSKLSLKLHDLGAKHIRVCASHGLFTGDSMDLIEKSHVDSVLVSDSLPLPKNASKKVSQLSLGSVLANVITMEHKRSDAAFDDEQGADISSSVDVEE